MSFRADSGVQYGFEVVPGDSIGKNQLSKRSAIEFANRVDYLITKAFANFVEGGFAGLYYFSRYYVGIYDGYAEVGEHIGDG